MRLSAQYRPEKPTVLDLPVSNNGGRVSARGLVYGEVPVFAAYKSTTLITNMPRQVRWIIYKKGLEQQYAIVTPQEIGGRDALPIRATSKNRWLRGGHVQASNAMHT